ncbi:MAG: hypothetical protein K0Q66_98 [Chitinophagaceae bacterium]|jgi:hypothetical protein|nr:hypothetical protein [Chitinophagaceae bacterium]
MKSYFILPVCLLVVLQSQAQQHFIRIPYYSFAERKGEDKMVVLGMPVGRWNISSIHGDTSALRTAGGLVIDVVCTDYPTNAPLTSLNQKRFNELFRVFPYLKRTIVQQLNFFRQTDGNTKASAANMFHGLVIKFRPAQSPATIKEEIGKLDALMEEAFPTEEPEDEPTKEFPVESIELDPGMPGSPRLSTTPWVTVYQEGRYVVVDPRDMVAEWKKQGWLATDSLKRIRANEVTYYVSSATAYISLMRRRNDSITLIVTDKVDWFNEVVMKFSTRRPKKRGAEIDIDSIGKAGYKPKPLRDSTILKTFERNNWKNAAIVADVTGSMYPYSAQLLIWLRKNIERNGAGSFVFFNDGDRKPDNEKIAGHTGGVYSKVCNNFEDARDLLKSVMRNGLGGDVPENNIEALLQAERDFPTGTFTIMIADNWAPIKDKSLVHQLARPVRVILCGVYEDDVNVDYLNLARQTRGSLHLRDTDLVSLASMNEGEVLKLGLRSYKLINGSFTPITDEKASFIR